MAKVRIKSFVTARAIRELLDIDSSILDNAGELIADRIYSLAKRGRRMKPDGSTESLPKLEKSTIKTRKAYSGKTGEAFDDSRTRSNLTLTGELLDSIRFISDEKKQTVEIFFDGDHTGGFSNDELFGWLKGINKKYDVLTLNKGAQKKVLSLVRRALTKKLKRNNQR